MIHSRGRESSKRHGEKKAEDREGWHFKYNVQVGHTETMPSEQKRKEARMSCGGISAGSVPGAGQAGDGGSEKWSDSRCSYLLEGNPSRVY